MKSYAAVLAVGALGLSVWGCSGNGSSSNPGSPMPSTGNVVTITNDRSVIGSLTR